MCADASGSNGCRAGGVVRQGTRGKWTVVLERMVIVISQLSLPLLFLSCFHDGHLSGVFCSLFFLVNLS